MVMMTLFARQQKRRRYKEQTFGLCGRGVIWENGIKTCIISYEMNHQSRFDAGYRMLGAGVPR